MNSQGANKEYYVGIVAVCRAMQYAKAKSDIATREVGKNTLTILVLPITNKPMNDNITYHFSDVELIARIKYSQEMRGKTHIATI